MIVRIRFLKDTGVKLAGDEILVSPQRAKQYVKKGIAEIIEEDKSDKYYRKLLKEEAEKFKYEDFAKLCDKQAGLNKYYQDIIKILKEYMDLSEDCYALISTWIIATYFHKQFSSFSYLFFNAMKGSGKTRLLKIIAELSKNGSVAGSMTEAVLFRTAKERTLCIDELENINAKGNENLKLLLNSAYKRGAFVERMTKKKTLAGETQVAEKYEVYCPICMANIKGMENVLADRCISLILEKSANRKITRLIENFSDNLEFKLIKEGLSRLTSKVTDNLNLFGDIFNEWNFYVKNDVSLVNNINNINNINNVSNVTRENLRHYDIYDRNTFFQKIDKTDLSGRDLELFFPLFIISSLFSEEALNSLMQTARKITKERKEVDREENKDVRLIEFIAQSEYQGFYEVGFIVNQIREFYSEDEWYEKGVSRALKRLGLLIERRSTGKKRQVKINVEKAKQKLLMFKDKEEILLQEVMQEQVK